MLLVHIGIAATSILLVVMSTELIYFNVARDSQNDPDRPLLLIYWSIKVILLLCTLCSLLQAVHPMVRQ
jgi:hypothetical protein